MKVGDEVILISIPPELHDDEGFGNRNLFEKCEGKTFKSLDLKRVEGLPCQLAQIDVGYVLGKSPFLETIWVEPQYLKLGRSEEGPLPNNRQ